MADETSSTDPVDPTPVTSPSTSSSTPASTGSRSLSAGGRRRASDRRPRRAARGPGERRRPRAVGIVVTSALVVVAILTSVSVTMVYNDLQGNIEQNAFTPHYADGYVKPKDKFSNAPHKPLNILVMGSDSRDCSGCHIDKEKGGGSDTTILLHLSADRKHAYGVSIPRDTMIDRPACANNKGEQFPAETYQQWNAGFSIAGPGCTIEQVESITKIPIDDSVVVNFEGFQDMVDAVGGVQVCVPEEIDDREHGIDIPAGTRTISGKEALSYVRVRHGVGDGSDLSRIKRQQAFIASLVSAVFSAKTLTKPFKVLAFLQAATKNLQFDDKTANLAELASLGSSFKNIGLDNIKFFTAPIEADPQNPTARVVFAPDAHRVWKHLRKDRTLPDDLTTGAIRAGAVPGQKQKHPGKKDESQNGELESAGLCTL